MSMKMKMVVVIVMRRLSLMRVTQMCTILPVEINRWRKGVWQCRNERFCLRKEDWKNRN